MSIYINEEGEESRGQIIITGGTFNFDVSLFVADGYEATEVAGIWTVVAE